MSGNPAVDYRPTGRPTITAQNTARGWIGVGIKFWKPEMWHLVLVNAIMVVALIFAYGAPKARVRTGLHLALIMMTIYGALTVWTTPSLEMPL